MSGGIKLALAGAIFLIATGYMAYLGASSSWQYYLTVDECGRNLAQYTGKRVRVSGRVTEGSLQIADDRWHARFTLEGKQHRVPVSCSGQLPDNLEEGVDVVVAGRLSDDGTLIGDEVLTRCASKYEAEPSEVPKADPRWATP